VHSKILTGEGTVVETMFGLVSFGHWIWLFFTYFARNCQNLIIYARKSKINDDSIFAIGCTLSVQYLCKTYEAKQLHEHIVHGQGKARTANFFLSLCENKHTAVGLHCNEPTRFHEDQRREICNQSVDVIGKAFLNRHNNKELGVDIHQNALEY